MTSALDSSTKYTAVIPGSEAGADASDIPLLARTDQFGLTMGDGGDCATNAEKTCPNVWDVYGSEASAQQQIVNSLVKAGIKNVGLLEEQVANSQVETPYFYTAANKANITVSTVSAPSTALTLTSEMNELQSDGAKAVFVEGIASFAGYALVARASLGWNANMYFDDGASAVALSTLVPAADLTNAYVDLWNCEVVGDSNANIARLRKYGAAFGLGKDGALPLVLAALGWQMVTTLHEAVVTAKGVTTTKALDAAMLKFPKSTPYNLYLAKYGWTKNDHENVLDSPSDFKVVQAGPFVNGQIG
jgi:hypothetical protein